MAVSDDHTTDVPGRDLEENEHVAEKRAEKVRVCSVGRCKEEVTGGIVGMAEHVEEEHDLEDLVREVSFTYSPQEPVGVHHPNGTTHFTGSGRSRCDSEVVETRCGVTIRASDLDGVEDATNLVSYRHADADDYCGTCIRLFHRDMAGAGTLPEPLRDEEGGDEW